ncbi:MAG: antitoxin VapB family protein [Kiritimatiellia bacterium]|jgi:predicted CopG family antitoxin|nr:antitoxin VapB family protein [Kiritimatiellia bacterium]MDP6631217.1 antitoxin VapB family protein [Kiritimatiellia bacterium]MDP6809548.1 antitoxin VapB family protein [Kiritimatiellia bacterium]MDP7023601.1 antitoxin VapB family protein [Kiritimatiellia bacterium]
MKTISLTDEAYERLKEWKDESSDSFSRVVLRVVPEKGTLGQMLEDVSRLPVLNEEQARVMEESARYGRDLEGSRDPWTS